MYAILITSEERLKAIILSIKADPLSFKDIKMLILRYLILKDVSDAYGFIK
jgi:hypothetical protein